MVILASKYEKSARKLGFRKVDRYTLIEHSNILTHILITCVTLIEHSTHSTIASYSCYSYRIVTVVTVCYS